MKWACYYVNNTYKLTKISVKKLIELYELLKERKIERLQPTEHILYYWIPSWWKMGSSVGCNGSKKQEVLPNYPKEDE